MFIFVVIDFCLTKNLISDPDTNYTSLHVEWASKANCIQRKGMCALISNSYIFNNSKHTGAWKETDRKCFGKIFFILIKANDEFGTGIGFQSLLPLKMSFHRCELVLNINYRSSWTCFQWKSIPHGDKALLRHCHTKLWHPRNAGMVLKQYFLWNHKAFWVLKMWNIW